jgi:uncharacterized protein
MKSVSISKTRIAGFDLARAYAIFGMYIVNFNIVFGNYHDDSGLGKLLMLFNGNSSTAFVILAGMGLALMTNRPHYTPEEKHQLRTTVFKRAMFLFVLGLLLFVWWPADILHFYGGYMKIAALLLFVPRTYLLWAAAAAVVIFHVLFLIIPFESGWNFDTLQYVDFWTIGGFLRNTLYNGWNPIFPWLAYFLVGMWLGRLDWQQSKTPLRIGGIGLAIFLLTAAVQAAAQQEGVPPDLRDIILADYLPPFLPFMTGTTGAAMMLIAICIAICRRLPTSQLLEALTSTGQMTLTHYVVHLTAGMLLFAAWANRPLELALNKGNALSPTTVLLFSLLWFVGSVVFSYVWKKRFQHGPLEGLMRRVSMT